MTLVLVVVLTLLWNGKKVLEVTVVLRMVSLVLVVPTLVTCVEIMWSTRLVLTLTACVLPVQMTVPDPMRTVMC